MIQIGILLALIAAIIWSLVNVVDRFILNMEEDISNQANIISSISLGVLFLILFVFSGVSTPDSYYFMLVFAFIGVFYYLAAYFYYRAIKLAEATNISIVLNLSSVFILLGDVVLFGRIFTGYQVFGMFIVLTASVMVSYSYKDIRDLEVDLAFGMMTVSCVLYAFRSLLTEFAITSLDSDPLQVYAWSIIGVVVAALLTLVKKENRNNCIAVFKNYPQKVKYILLTKNLSGIGVMAYTFSVSFEKVSVTSFVASSQPIFVFLISYIVYSVFNVNELREDMDRVSVLKKIAAILLTIVGIYLL